MPPNVKCAANLISRLQEMLPHLPMFFGLVVSVPTSCFVLLAGLKFEPCLEHAGSGWTMSAQLVGYVLEFFHMCKHKPFLQKYKTYQM